MRMRSVCRQAPIKSQVERERLIRSACENLVKVFVLDWGGGSYTLMMKTNFAGIEWSGVGFLEDGGMRGLKSILPNWYMGNPKTITAWVYLLFILFGKMQINAAEIIDVWVRRYSLDISGVARCGQLTLETQPSMQVLKYVYPNHFRTYRIYHFAYGAIRILISRLPV
jgi:hypothetical protein